MTKPIPAAMLLAALVPAAGEPGDLSLGPTAKPGEANAGNPAKGDHAFYTYCVPGARFEAQDGTHWEIENIADTGYVRIRNLWYPREELTIPMTQLRETIHAWIEPVEQVVPRLTPSK